ncbi:MAG: hypothetical protein NTW25_15645 [Candidatus Kapabacteria bacterium]|nr:hypothetical protein [Candidatus Kapabacteria bacterium]
MKNLNTYLDKAKNLKINKAIIPNDEIRIVLGKVEKINLPKADNYNNDFIHFLRKYKMTIISSAVLAISFATFLNTNKIETTSQDKKSNDVAIVNKFTNSNKIENTNQTETKQTVTNVIDKNDNDSIITLPILKLTDEELSKLGINRVGSGYSFNMQSKFNLKTKKLREELYKAGYDTTLQNAYYKIKAEITASGMKTSEIIKDKNWDIFNGSKILPITYYAESINGNGGETSNGYNCGGSPINEEGSGDVFREFYQFSLKNKLRFRDFNNYDSIKINKYELNYTSQLIPIFFKLDSADTKNVTALFFVPTRELLSLLPKRYYSVIKSNIPCINKLLLNKISLEEIQTKKY